MQNKVINNANIEIIWNTEVEEIIGKAKVEGLKLKNNKTGETSDLKVDGVFVAIGHNPESDLFKGKLETDEKGFVKNHFGKYHCGTNIPGVFVAGDVADAKYKQAVVSAGMGCMAALDTLHYLSENDIL